MEQEVKQEATQVETPRLTFNLSLEDVNAILEALGEAPLKSAINVYMAIRQSAELQIAQQNAAKAAQDGAGE